MECHGLSALSGVWGSGQLGGRDWCRRPVLMPAVPVACSLHSQSPCRHVSHAEARETAGHQLRGKEQINESPVCLPVQSLTSYTPPKLDFCSPKVLCYLMPAPMT